MFQLALSHAVGTLPRTRDPAAGKSATHSVAIAAGPAGALLPPEDGSPNGSPAGGAPPSECSCTCPSSQGPREGIGARSLSAHPCSSSLTACGTSSLLGSSRGVNQVAEGHSVCHPWTETGTARGSRRGSSLGDPELRRSKGKPRFCPRRAPRSAGSPGVLHSSFAHRG